jgi:hypothetical protein
MLRVVKQRHRFEDSGIAAVATLAGVKYSIALNAAFPSRRRKRERLSAGFIGRRPRIVVDVCALARDRSAPPRGRATHLSMLPQGLRNFPKVAFRTAFMRAPGRASRPDVRVQRA